MEILNDENNKNDNKKNKITFINLLKVIFHRWKLFILISLSVTIIGTIGLKLYSKQKEIYVSYFTYNIPSIAEGKYLDGKTFNYSEIIDYDNLQRIVNSNEDYKNIDIDDLVDSSNFKIGIKKTYDSTTKELLKEEYVLTLPRGFFKSLNQAKSFANDIIYTPIYYTNKCIEKNDYKEFLLYYDEAARYETQVNILTNQYNLIYNHYQKLVTDYGEVQLQNNELLTKKINDLVQFFVNNKLSDLTYEIKQNGYVKNISEEKISLELEKKEKENKILYDEKKLADLTNMVNDLISNSSSSLQSLDLDSYNTAITNLIIEINDLKEEIDYIDLKLNNLVQAPETFINKMNYYKNKLEELSNELIQVEKEIIPNYSKINYMNQKVLIKENSLSLTKAAAVSLFIGIISAAAINIILDYKYIYSPLPIKTKKEEK